MDEIEEMDNYVDEFSIDEEHPYNNKVPQHNQLENETLRNVMYNFLSSNLTIPNDLTSIILAAMFLIISWKALQIVVKLLFAVLWPVIAFSSLFFLLPMIGQQDLFFKLTALFKCIKNAILKILELLMQHHKQS